MESTFRMRDYWIQEGKPSRKLAKVKDSLHRLTHRSEGGVMHQQNIINNRLSRILQLSREEGNIHDKKVIKTDMELSRSEQNEIGLVDALETNHESFHDQMALPNEIRRLIQERIAS